MRESEVREKLAECLEVVVKREKLADLYLIMKDRGLVRSQADFARKVGLSRSAAWHLLNDDARMPMLVTLRDIDEFALYWLARTYTRANPMEPEDLAEELLDSETLKEDLVEKLSTKPYDEEN